MTNPIEMLEALETQMMGLAASATAAASIARMVRETLSGGAQGADAENSADDGVVDSVLLPRTFGDGRGKARRATHRE